MAPSSSQVKCYPTWWSGFLSEDENPDIWLTCEANGKAVGFCYAVPVELAEGAWNMLAIAVLPTEQGSEYGGAIAKHLEAELKERVS